LQTLESVEKLFYEDLRIVEIRIEELATRLHFPSYMLYMIKGGKRLRPLLALTICKSLGGESSSALDYAAAIELVHSAVLVHDDILDEHALRRGRKPLYKQLDPRRALLLSDMLLSSALKLTNASDGSKDTLSDTVYTLCRGVALEPLNPIRLLKKILKEGLLPTFYETVARLKTGELFGAAAKMGAIAARTSGKLIEAAYQYGIELGIAYQLADDLVDFRLWSREGFLPDTGSLITAVLFIPYISVNEQMTKYLLNRVLRSYTLSKLLRPLGLKKALIALTPDKDIVEAFTGIALNRIKLHCNNAIKTLAEFPANKYTQLLTELPEYIINKQLAEVRCPLS
jgi:geranylgeranyl pyrophosphate synthase